MQKSVRVVPERDVSICSKVAWTKLDLLDQLIGVREPEVRGRASWWAGQGVAILAVPGLGFVEMRLGDLDLWLGYVTAQRDPYPPEMREARDRGFAACRKNGVAFLEDCSPENIVARLDEVVRVNRRAASRHGNDRAHPPEAQHPSLG